MTFRRFLRVLEHVYAFFMLVLVFPLLSAFGGLLLIAIPIWISSFILPFHVPFGGVLAIYAAIVCGFLGLIAGLKRWRTRLNEAAHPAIKK